MAAPGILCQAPDSRSSESHHPHRHIRCQKSDEPVVHAERTVHTSAVSDRFKQTDFHRAGQQQESHSIQNGFAEHNDGLSER